jgi:hypothetical protein
MAALRREPEQNGFDLSISEFGQERNYSGKEEPRTGRVNISSASGQWQESSNSGFGRLGRGVGPHRLLFAFQQF